ncbi:cation efflux system protein CusF [Erwiniaceae bacterium L1_54_6]|nr:cation efflux system protein CusF [Erwiniaceae bacterium L1_54_6]
MHQFIKVALFGMIPALVVSGVQASEQHQGMMSQAAMTAQQPVIIATGVVKQIDLANKKITIAHQAIPALGWPAMTMRFTFTTQDDSINALKVGSPVNFSFIQQGNISLLQEITVSHS